jgi:asparagine synthase (glutamine-hydrolysing)
LRHRGPDGFGTHLEGPVVLGHTRLSIIDVEGGAQPIANEDGSILTVYNGEIWNHEALRAELIRAGHRFRTRCDTEVLVHGWEEWGEDLLPRLSGMFAFALWDGNNERLLLARDRVGKKPLYVKQTPDGLAFGSDARSVLIATQSNPEVDETALASFLFQRYVVAPQTLFRGVERLEAGHLLLYDRRHAETRPYWQLDAEATESLSATELRELLREAVRARLMSDVPIGILLSGGIDSSAVLGLATEAGVKHVDTFTIGFSDSLYDERGLARISAARHGARYHEVVVDPVGFVETLPRLAWLRDEPIAEPSEVPLLLLAEFAARHVKVALGGDGGDELFGGYPKYRAERLLRLLGPFPGPGLAAMARLGSKTRTHRRLGRAAETLSIADERLRWASWFRSFSVGEIERLVRPDLAAHATADRLLAPLAAKLAPYAAADAGRRMLLGDFHTYLPDNMLLRTDRVLMGASLEGRVPLLDREVVERVSATSARERMSLREGKTLLRRAVADLIPPELRSAPKRGFPVPVARMLNEGSGGALSRLLLSERALSRGLLRHDAVRGLVESSPDAVVERDLKLFTLISLELWLRANVDQVTIAPPASLEELLGEDEPELAALAQTAV